LQLALSNIIRAQQQGEASVVRALRVPRSAGRANLGLVVRPVPVSQWSEGQSSPCARYSSVTRTCMNPHPNRLWETCLDSHRQRPISPYCWPGGSAWPRPQTHRAFPSTPPGRS
jgi:hypothetical protein